MSTQKSEQRIHKMFIFVSLAMILPFYINVPIFIGVFIYILWHKHNDIKTILKDNMYITAFIIFSLIVALWRKNYIGAGVSLAFFCYFLYFYYYREWIEAKVYLKLLNFHVLMSGLLSLWCIFTYLKYAIEHGYGVFYVFKYNNLQIRAEATFFNANYYGLYCVIMILTLCYLLFKINVKSYRVLYSFLLCLNIISVILTASRWLLPTILASVGIFAILLNQALIKYVVIGALVIIGAVVVKPSLLPRAESLAYAFKDRILLWTTGLKLFMLHPICGMGAMTVMGYYYLFTDNGNMHAHNLYIDILANYGIIGAIILGLALYQLIKQSRSLFLDNTLHLERAFVGSIITAIMVHGIMDVAILWVQTGYIILMLLAVKPDLWKELSKISITTSEEVKSQLYFHK